MAPPRFLSRVSAQQDLPLVLTLRDRTNGRCVELAYSNFMIPLQPSTGRPEGLVRNTPSPSINMNGAKVAPSTAPRGPVDQRFAGWYGMATADDYQQASAQILLQVWVQQATTAQLNSPTKRRRVASDPEPKPPDDLLDSVGPAEAVGCPCTVEDHGDELMNEVFIGGVSKISSLLWHSADWAQVYQGLRDYADVETGPWIGKNGTESRLQQYTLPLVGGLGPKSTRAYENATLLRDEKLAHIVDVQVETPEVPFGTYFHVRVRYCLTHEAPGKARLRIGYSIVFSKNTMLKGKIKSATEAGLQKTVEDCKRALMDFVELEPHAEPVGVVEKEPEPMAWLDELVRQRAPTGPYSGDEMLTSRLVIVGVVVVLVVHCFLYLQVGILLNKLRIMERHMDHGS